MPGSIGHPWSITQPSAATSIFRHMNPTLEKQAQALVDLLTEHGSLGNGKAREMLGWDEETYTLAKEGLYAQGLVAFGRGRGGSIRLAEPGGIQALGSQATRPLSQQASDPKGLQASMPISSRAYKPNGSEAQGTQAAKPASQKTSKPNRP